MIFADVSIGIAWIERQAGDRPTYTKNIIVFVMLACDVVVWILLAIEFSASTKI
jgi:hypothetical protein